MINLENAISDSRLFKLPFEVGTFILKFETLNSRSEFRFPKHLSVKIRKISFRNEFLTIGVKLDKEKEEKVYVKATIGNLLVSCSVDTDESYLSRYAYFALFQLMSIYDYYDFARFYWPDFFDTRSGKSKYLKVINDRNGFDIFLHPQYNFFFKPGENLYLPRTEPKIRRPIMVFTDKKAVEIVNNNGVGFCLADTLLQSWHSNHFPFLLTYKALLTQDKTKVKSFLRFVITDGEGSDYSPMQATLCKISGTMSSFAKIEGREMKGPNYSVNHFDNRHLDKFNSLFRLWQDAIQYLAHQPHTHYLLTHGFNNIKMRPAKTSMMPCKFLYEVPEICFLWKKNTEYYELEYKFKIGNKLFSPAEQNTAFFTNSKKEPTTFYLFDKLSDCLITLFLAERKFKIFVLRAHYEQHFKAYLEKLRTTYAVKDIGRTHG